MAALIIYILAGISHAWSYVEDRWWQRLLMIPFWMPMIGWGMFCEVTEWWRERGYDYNEPESSDGSE